MKVQNNLKTISVPFALDFDEMNRWLLDSLDLVASLGDISHSGRKQQRGPLPPVQEIKPVLRKLLDFQVMAFFKINEEDLDFTLIDCDPIGERTLIEEELEYHVEKGTFAWALYQNRPVVIASDVLGKRTLFHVMATKKRILGMFMGILDYDDPFIPDAIQKLVSIALLNCASLIENSILYDELNTYTNELEEANNTLKQEILERKLLENELVQAQKLEAIGQLAAGIAHEINNPAQFIGDNIRFLQDSLPKILILIEKYRHMVKAAKEGAIPPELGLEVSDYEREMDINYFLKEIPITITQSLEGINRISKIVSAMKVFSHPGGEEKIHTDINKTIESTITVARNVWKYVADVVTDFDQYLPLILCYPGEFNQVILNIIVNAADAIADTLDNGSGTKGTITVSTQQKDDWVEIQIKDTGSGIPETAKTKIFDPFFTTKEVGKGVGQGLAISHNIIVEKHGGMLTFETAMNKGTSFIIKLPINPETQSTA